MCAFRASGLSEQELVQITTLFLCRVKTKRFAHIVDVCRTGSYVALPGASWDSLVFVVISFVSCDRNLWGSIQFPQPAAAA